MILQVDLLVNENKDTLSIFVNHWPSRRSGEDKSEPRRIEAAETRKEIC